MSMQIQYQCKELVFHFNKKHLEDPQIPMWVIKTHGVTFYVNHVSADIPWSTKETPDNTHTKGSIKFKRCKLILDPENNATVTSLSLLDKTLPSPKGKHTRLLMREGSTLLEALRNGEFKHTEFKEVVGACHTEFVICDMTDELEVTVALLKYSGGYRILSPNEHYYQVYDTKQSWIDAIFDDDEDDD